MSLRQFECQRDRRRRELDDAPPITSECEECGASSQFPAAQNGTTQNCPKCDAFMDVGSCDWPEDLDFGEAESVARPPENVEDAIDAAAELDEQGDWTAAIAAYREIGRRWPEHATYSLNCLAAVQRKLDRIR